MGLNKGRLLSRVIIAGLVGIVGAEMCQASIEKIYVSRESRVNPETGVSKPRILNPSGEVEMTYTQAGIQLKYTTSNGAVEAVQIYADSPELSKFNSDGSTNRFNEFVSESYQKNGRRFPGDLLKLMAQHEQLIPENAPEGYKPGRLLVILDAKGRVGFNPTFTTADVIVVQRGGTGNLRTEIYDRIASQANQLIAAEQAAQAALVAARAAAEPAVPERPPMGFITAKDAVVQRTCETLFRPAI